MIPTRILFQIHDLRRLLITKLQNSPYFCIFKYARAVKQKVCKEAENRDPDWGRLGRGAFFFSPHTTYGPIRLARFTRVRLLRHALPISLQILRKKTDCFAVYLITYSLNDFHSGYVVSFCIVSLVFKLLFSSRIM